MTASLAATIVAVALGLPLALASGYLLLLAAFSAAGRRPKASPRTGTRFRLVIPAHDEGAGIARTIRNLQALDYPAELRRLMVVADNCSDDTAAVAAAAGAEVLIRDQPDRRGKGYALALAFDRCLAEGWAEAVVVIDADTLAEPNLLTELAGHFSAGGEVLQVHYGILADRDSWRTRLLRLSFTLFHGVRSVARERLGLSCGLRGNGMAFAVDVLRRVPHRAFSVVEDLEYGLDLGAAGVRVGYVAGTQVLGEMPSNEPAARSQRQRWEGGRAQLRKRIPELIAQAWRKRDWVLADLAFDLALPPLTTLVTFAAVGTGAVLVAAYAGWVRAVALAPWLFSDFGLTVYVLRGWMASGVGWRGLVDLAYAPAFVLWKLWRVRFGAPPTEWVRTARATQPGPAEQANPQIPR